MTKAWFIVFWTKFVSSELRVLFTTGLDGLS